MIPDCTESYDWDVEQTIEHEEDFSVEGLYKFAGVAIY